VFEVVPVVERAVVVVRVLRATRPTCVRASWFSFASAPQMSHAWSARSR
jgi:hypothetical protein